MMVADSSNGVVLDWFDDCCCDFTGITVHVTLANINSHACLVSTIMFQSIQVSINHLLAELKRGLNCLWIGQSC